MGKQFGAGVTVKPYLQLPVLERLAAELKKKYDGKKLTYSSAGHTHTNIQAGNGTDFEQEEIFKDVKDALKRLGFDVVERKEGNKRYLFIKS